MLPKRKRVTKELFQDIMKNGKILSSPLFLLRYKAQKQAQYAIVVPKNVGKQAVLRNKLRRQGYNALAQNTKIPSILGIFFYKKQTKTPIFKDIKKNIDLILSKINI